MSFIGSYSRKLVSGRLKFFLIAAVTVCVLAFVYTYLATEFITTSLLTSIADNSPHIRLFLQEKDLPKVPEMLKKIRSTSGVIRADSGIYVESEYYITTRRLATKIGEPGEVFYTGRKKFQFTGYAFDSTEYMPPVLMENVYSSINRERMERHPEDEPIKIMTDPSEVEQRENWVIIDKELNEIFPLGASAFGDVFELHFIDTDQKEQIIPLRTAGFLTGSPLSIGTSEMPHPIYTKISTLEKFTQSKDRKSIVDIVLEDQTQADVLGQKFQKEFGLENYETWIDVNETAIPFLNGLETCIYVGVFGIVVISVIGIFIIISMVAIDKTKQLAILYAMGMDALQLRLLFLLIGVRTAVYALILGIGLAFIGGWLSLGYWTELVKNFCTIPQMPLVYSTVFLGIFAFVTFILCCVAAWLPTRLHISQDPIHNLRSE